MRSSRWRRYSATLMTILVVWSCGAGDPKKAPSLGEIYQSGLAAYNDSNYTDFLNAMKHANDLRPNHPSVIYNLASGQALTGNHDSALFWLNRYADLGIAGEPDRDSDFQSLTSDPLFQAVVQRIKENSRPIGSPAIVISLPDSTLITEGIAYDSRSGNFFVGSIRQRKIMQIDANGRISTFVPTKTGGLGSVFGLVVDTTQNLLWATSAVFEQTPPEEPRELGQTGIFAFDLITGELCYHQMLPPDSIPHLFGDIALGPDGEIFMSDDRGKTIYWYSIFQGQLVAITTPGEFTSPQGLVVEPSGKSLIVADYTSGLYRVDIKSGALTVLEPREPMCLLGIDGLCSDGEFLYAIQNGIRPQRVVRLTLDSQRDNITKMDVLAASNPDFDEPTLGVIANGQLYFNGTSQWRFLNKDGTLANPENLQRPKIFALSIE